jgi:hypothetical protein
MVAIAVLILATIVFGFVVIALIATGPIDRTRPSDWLMWLIAIIACSIVFVLAFSRLLVEVM